MEEYDTYNPKILSILLVSYYYKDAFDTRHDIQELLIDCDIWKNYRFWQSAYLESVYKELRNKEEKVIPLKLRELKGNRFIKTDEK